MGIELAVWAELEVRDSFASDDLATEHRWERIVLESLLSCSEVDAVHSILPIWNSPKPMHPKFRDGCPASILKDLVVVAPNCWPIQHNHPKIQARGLVLNNLYLHSLVEDPAFKALRERCNNNVMFIDPFDNYTKSHNLDTISGVSPYLEPFFIPRIPNVLWDNKPFNNNIILWPHKAALDNMRYKTVDMKPIYDWVANQLEKNPTFEFHILTAVSESSAIYYGYHPVEHFFWNHETTALLSKYKNRVFIHMSLGWTEVLDIYKRTKLTISSLRGGSFTAGAAQESAMHGIPFVFTLKDTSYISMWEDPLLSCSATWSSPEYFQLMDKLLYDESYYNKISVAMCKQVYYYTYEYFNKKLLEALHRRNMI